VSKNILILCTGNSCRSQIAEGYFKKFWPQETIYSAGIEAHGMNPRAMRVMKEDGVDISDQRSKRIEELPNLAWDLVITVCDHAREVCPVLPGKHMKLHASFEDPAKAEGDEEAVLQVFRRVRDQIKEFARNISSTRIPVTNNS